MPPGIPRCEPEEGVHGPAAGLDAVAPPVDQLGVHADGPGEGGPREAADLVQPFEALGEVLRQHGVTELACRLISLHLRRGTPLEEIIDQCQGIAEMQPFFNTMPDGKSVAVLGLGDGIAHILKAHLRAREEREAETAQEAAIEMKAAA